MAAVTQENAVSALDYCETAGYCWRLSPKGDRFELIDNRCGKNDVRGNLLIRRLE